MKDDLVRRRDVFEVINKALKAPTIDLAIAIAKSIPSAQPEIVRCEDCLHRIENDHYGQKGYLNIKAYCELDTGDPFELGRNAENDDWFCADAERRE